MAKIQQPQGALPDFAILADPRAARPPLREPARPEVRGRNGELLTRNNRSNVQAEQFDVPERFREKGWALQWVRSTCHGKPDPQNIQNHMENGFRPVPCSRMPGYFHPDKNHQGVVERDGLVLMERPQSLQDEAEADGIRAARQQRRNQAADFMGVSKVIDEAGAAGYYEAGGGAEDSRNYAAPKLNRTVEGSPTALYPHRELALSDDE